MKVLITGANGMLATNIIEELLRQGYNVRGLLRQRTGYKGPRHERLELVEGDFTDFKTISEAIDECDYIIHSAAITAQNLLNYEAYRRVNVDATEQLLKLALVKRIKRFLYVSSANTVGAGTFASPGCEQMSPASPLSGSLYGKTKAEAEAIVMDYANMMSVVVVNPTFMIGRYGSPQGSNRILNMARRITFCPPGGKNFIDVEDAAKGVILALEKGINGERYLLAGFNLPFKTFFSFFPQVRRIIVIPATLMLVLGGVGSLLRLTGIRTGVSLTNMRILCLPVAYDNSKARRMLGFSPYPIPALISKFRKIHHDNVEKQTTCDRQ